MPEPTTNHAAPETTPEGSTSPSDQPVRGAEEEIAPVAQSTERTQNTAVLFVCVKNGGKSQMAAGLLRQDLAAAGLEGAVVVSSAGTQPGSKVNALAAEVLAEVGADIAGETPTQLTPEAMREAGHVVILGPEAQVEPLEGVKIERWELDEPSARGIEGRERMELVRDDIHLRVRELRERLLG
ncbi:low molecular weight phosphatase family protein [Nesterenkonia sp. E16_7]|uniref:arsenate reductase/protein-tyrosine-phosphatase family protein n=1 Tax=unclassified Nesterenkonia TaxID=2629769 RepID=UPI001A915809|nr:low molecular weight phosphatase family protein [Nesterenkonia sp. E16_10]MBO0599127.1 low molecular weight phosphatase family protein [Nesterenkonia sp. E16_7]